MKNTVKIISLILAFLMLAAPLAACTGKTPDNSDGTESADVEKLPLESESDEKTPSDSEDSTGENDPEGGSEDSTADGGKDDPETDTKKEDSSEEESEGPQLPIVGEKNEYTDLVVHSNGLKNGVNPYFTNAERAELTIDNQIMSLGYGMVGTSNKMFLSHLSNTKGESYISNTFDVVLNKDGKKYYASRSLDSSILNIYRYGFYYYETRIEGQTFMNDTVVESENSLAIDKYERFIDITEPKYKNGILSYRVTFGEDPQIRYVTNFASTEYNHLEFKMRVSSAASCTAYLLADNKTYRPYSFESVAGEDFVTYLIPLKAFESYAETETVTGLRLDINGEPNTTVEFESIRFLNCNFNGAPESLSMQRSFHTYSDKLHHLLQLSTSETVEGVDSIQIVTTLAADTVAAVVVKDADGLKYSLEGVDWNSAEYVGFDVKNAGIFGYILPAYEGSGSLEVTQSGGVYTIIQTKIPEDGRLIPSAPKTENADDFYMGQRLYNDENHDFATFITEAENERHPLTNENITVDELFNDAKFVGYDPLRGSYVFTLSGSNFNKSYYIHQNRQYRVKFTVNGGSSDRKAYFMTHMSNNGGVECANLLGEGDLLLPVPIQVAKNFSGDGENTIYNIDDFQYSETYFPMIVKGDETRNYTIVHSYQNWGIFPVKQISSIQFHTPFYHLSTGVTETNCIVPFNEAGPGLPDHRAMSAPFWPTQPQHTSGGSHNFLFFYDEEGKMVISNTTYAKIDSYGPTYADIELGFVTADNRIEAKYVHMEMPQTDENRTYYERSYTFLEDVSFKDFANDFKFYRCTDNNSSGWYKRIGFLNESNEYQVVDSLHDRAGTAKYVLGDNCPYFSFFDMQDRAPDSTTAYGYVNISFLVYNYEVICNGEKIEPKFVIMNYGDYIHLSFDLGEVTFKKGDKITINSMLMPWGSEKLNDGVEDIAKGEYEYTSDLGGGVLYMDKNVRDVRENTLLNPVKVTADENCQVLDSVFLPKLRSDDGKSATFTISGGENNIAVRVYGFSQLSALKIEEFRRGRWQTYKVASASEPDGKGYGYFYDGYMVHYDPDGTYSYSFIIPMEDGEPRQFRVSPVEDFNSWPKVHYEDNSSSITTENDPLNVYVDANELHSFAEDTLGYISKLELLKDPDETPFVRYFANSGAIEGVITPFKLEHDAYSSLESTGQYAVIKYRLASDSPIKLKNFQFFSSTVNDKPKDNTESCAYFDLKYDDQWHVLILDLSSLIHPSKFAMQDDGKYLAKYFRIDIFNMAEVPEDMYIDLAYVGLSDSLEKVYAINQDMSEVTFVTNAGSDRVDPTTGIICNDTPLNVYIPADKIAAASQNLALDKYELSEDGSFVRLHAAVGSKYEAQTTLYSVTNPLYKNIDSTGQYLVFKYRMQTDSTVKLNGLEVFASTENNSAVGDDNTDYYMLNYDGNWHVVVMDLSKMMPDFCVADEENGKYRLNYLRFDFFSPNISDSIYVDYAYIGLADDLSDIYEFAKDESEVLLVTATDKETPIDPKTGKPINSNNTPLNVYVNGAAIQKQIEAQKVGSLFSSVELAKDGSYLRMYANSAAKEAYVKVFNAADEEYAELESTGKYLVFKYRLAKLDGVSNTLQIYTATEIDTYADDGRANYYSLVFDDKWHVVVIDATALIPHAYFPPQEDGVYKANYMRFDFFNGEGLPNDLYMDIAYVGICDELSKIYEFNSDMSEIILVEGPSAETAIDPTTGLPIAPPEIETDPKEEETTEKLPEGTDPETCEHTLVYTATDDLLTYTVTCAKCGLNETRNGINQEGLTVLDADKLLSVGYTEEAIAGGGQPIGTLTKQTDSFYNDMPYMNMTVTRSSSASSVQSHIWLKYDQKIENVGKYVAIIYRSQMIHCGSVYINSASTGVSANQQVETASPAWNSNCYNGWQLSVYDFSGRSNWSNETGVGTIRIDLLKNSTATGKVSYLTPGNFVDIAYIGFFNSQAEAEKFFASATEKYGLDEKYRTNISKINDDATYAKTAVGQIASYDLSGATLSSASLSINGWFMTGGGVKEYKYVVVGDETVETSLGAGGNKTPGVGDGDAYLNIAQGLGLDETALSGVTCSKTLSLAGFEGQTVTVCFIAVTNSGEEIVSTVFANVKVPN